MSSPPSTAVLFQLWRVWTFCKSFHHDVPLFQKIIFHHLKFIFTPAICKTTSCPFCLLIFSQACKTLTPCKDFPPKKKKIPQSKLRSHSLPATEICRWTSWLCCRIAFSTTRPCWLRCKQTVFLFVICWDCYRLDLTFLPLHTQKPSDKSVDLAARSHSRSSNHVDNAVRKEIRFWKTLKFPFKYSPYARTKTETSR